MCNMYFIVSYTASFVFSSVECFGVFEQSYIIIHYYSHRHFINSCLCRMLSNDQHYYVHVSTVYAILLTNKW
jgi:hypothetical protein